MKDMICKIWILLREYRKDRTIGRLFSPENDFVCYILERPWLDNQKDISCIPEGIYCVKKHFSPAFGRCFAFDNAETAPRTDILAHAGNFVNSDGKNDSKGCLLTGNGLADID